MGLQKPYTASGRSSSLSKPSASEALLIHQQIDAALQKSRFRLRFPDWLEKEFACSQDEASRHSFFRNIFFLLVAMVLMGGGVWWFIPISTDSAWPVLFGALLLVIVSCALFVSLAEMNRWYQWYMAFYTWLGLSLLLMMQVYIHQPELRVANQIGSLYGAIMAYTMLGLRFRAATIAGWGAVAFFCVFVFLKGVQVDWHLFHRTFSGASILGMFLCYASEKRARIMFMQTRISELEKDRIKELNEELEKVSREDSLTGLANRRYFEQAYASEWRRAMRENKPLAVLLLDVDFFKRYNDAYGHLRGDVCLQQVADILNEQARRPGDMVARYGGEEFVVLYPNTSLPAAQRLADKLVESVHEACIAHDGSACADRVTVSVGVAAIIPSQEEGREALLEQADQALYQAKAAGRNRWVCAAA